MEDSYENIQNFSSIFLKLHLLGQKYNVRGCEYYYSMMIMSSCIHNLDLYVDSIVKKTVFYLNTEHIQYQQQ